MHSLADSLAPPCLAEEICPDSPNLSGKVTSYLKIFFIVIP